MKSFAPANISCTFVIKKSKNPGKSGSLGIGFTINKGVTVSLRRIKNKKNIIFFNNKKINFPTVNSVIKRLTNVKLKVNIASDLPLNSGFGISGASALAIAYATNELLKLKKSGRELAMIAHVAEVENLTGLGDVVNQFYGGFLIKYEPSYKFRVKRLPIRSKIYYKCFSKLDTRKILLNKKEMHKINSAGLNSLKKVKMVKKVNLAKLIEISKEFSIDSGLLKAKKVIQAIKKIEEADGNASMIMLGNAVFSDKPFKGSKEAYITEKSAHLL